MMKNVVALAGAASLVMMLGGSVMAQSSGAGVPNPADPAPEHPKATNGAPVQAPAKAGALAPKAGAMTGAAPMAAKKKKVAPKQ